MTRTQWTPFRAIVALVCAWSLIALIPGGGSLAWGQEALPKPRIAVLDFEGVGVSPAESAAVTDQLRSDLVRLRAFVVLDRAQVQSVLKELALQQTGITDQQQAVKIGKVLNVQYIVTGRVTAIPNAYQVSAQMVNVETTEIERSESIVYQGNIMGLLQQNIGSIAARLSEVPAPPSATAESPVPEASQQKKEGWPWWAWALIGVGVVGVVAAASGKKSSPGTGTTNPCPSSSGCGSVGVVW